MTTLEALRHKLLTSGFIFSNSEIYKKDMIDRRIWAVITGNGSSLTIWGINDETDHWGRDRTVFFATPDELEIAVIYQSLRPLTSRRP